MTRIFNFCAGPATLPLPVLEKARDELLDYRGLGMSVMEISHRSAAFDEVADSTEACLRRYCPYRTIMQYCFSPAGRPRSLPRFALNLASSDRPGAVYVVDGSWSKKAFGTAQRLGLAHLAASSEIPGSNRFLPENEWDLEGNHAYLHYVSNETISGVQFRHPP